MDYSSFGCPTYGSPRSGASNARRVRSERLNSPPSSTLSGNPNPTLFEGPLPELPKVPMANSAPGHGNPDVWKCLLCDQSMRPMLKAAHLESYAHLQNETTQKEVMDKAQERIQKKRVRKNRKEEKLVELMGRIKEMQEETQDKIRLEGLRKQQKEEGVRGVGQKLEEKRSEEQRQQNRKGEQQKKVGEHRMASAQNKGQNQAAPKYQQPVKDVTPWKCDVCEIAMKTHLKSYHIASSLHRHNENQRKVEERQKEQAILEEMRKKEEERKEKMRLEEEERTKQQERKIEEQLIAEEKRIIEERRIAEERSFEEERKEEERQREREISEAKRIQVEWEEEDRRMGEAEQGMGEEHEGQRLKLFQFEDEVYPEKSLKEENIEQQEKPLAERRRVTELPVVFGSTASNGDMQPQGLVGGHAEKDGRAKMLQYLLSQGYLQEESAEQSTKRVWTHEEMYLEYTEQMSQEHMLQEEPMWAESLVSLLPPPVSNVADLPPILYRVYDETSVSQYTIAGFNSGNPYLPSTPSKFKRMVKRHANWSSRAGTPFISVTTSPDAVGWHVAKKKADGGYGNIMVALIDTAALLTTCRSHIWKMHDAMDHFGLEPYKCQRRAYDNEYICALRIPAISIFACCQPDYFMDVALIFLKNLDTQR